MDSTTVEPQRNRGGRDLDPDARPVFCIVDPSLKDFVGHHFSYDNAVAAGAAAAGFRPVILAHRDVSTTIAGRIRLVRCFRRDMWGSRTLARYLPVRDRAGAGIRLTNRDFHRDLVAGLRGVVIQPGSVLFAHMIFRHQLPALARFVLDQPTGGPLDVILLLRYQATFYDDPLCVQAFRMLERAAAAGRRVRLATDSVRLAREIGRLTSLPIEIMPIPHTSAEAPPPRQPGRRLRFVSLGGARDEKGYVEILDAIRILHAEDGLDGMEFVLQSNDAQPDVQAAIDAFARENMPHVTLLREALSPERYDAELAAADVVLVPYWREIYLARTSGVFLEAAAAGKPVIATRNTWMSDELARYGAGLLVDDHDPPALAQAIRDTVRDQAGLARLATERRRDCLAIHNPAALVRQAIEGPPPGTKSQRDIRNVAIFYPWGDFLAGNTGASRRSGMLAEVLAPHVEAIRVLQGGPTETTRRGKLLVEGHALRIRQHLLRRAFRLPFRILLGRRHFGQDIHLWHHLERRLDPIFRRKVEAMVRWADVVLLEYSFWGSVVIPLCREAGIACILTNYDVLSDQITASPLLRRLTWRVERAALAAADTVVTVAPADQKALAADGIGSYMIANPVDMDLASRPAPAEPRELLRALYGIALPPGPCCLFVGSRFGPNIVAVERIRALAPAVPDIGFVIAGSVAAEERADNFVTLGVVSETVLTLLYRVAALSLIPLPHGTGSSLKTLEAMGAGLPVLGTSVAFRGLAIDPGVHGFVEDDLARWPMLIGEVFAAPERLSAAGEAARRFAEDYDFRKVFAAYFPLLGLQADPVRSAAAAAKAHRTGAERLLDELFSRALDDRSGSTALAMSLLLNEPPAPPSEREAQVRRALLTSLDRRLFPLAGRLLRLAEVVAGGTETSSLGHL